MITHKKAKKSVEGQDLNVWFHDIEVFPNYTLLVFKNRDLGNYMIMEILDRENGELADFINTQPLLIGYNCNGYDAQVIEYIIKTPGCTVEQIKSFNDNLINAQFKPYNYFSTRYLDLMEVNNYGIYSAKATSLKHLAFFFHMESVDDTPLDFNDEVSPSKRPDVIKYCIKDNDVTEVLYHKSLDLIDLRIRLGEEKGLNLMNYPEPKLAKEYFINEMSVVEGTSKQEIKNRRTFRDKIVVNDIILPYVGFKTDLFKDIENFYRGIVLKASVKSKVDSSKNVIVLKESIAKEVELNGTHYDYKAGGLHGCHKRGIYEANGEWVIKDIDYQSFYPRLAIIHKFAPKHIPVNVFTKVVQDLFDNRLKYNKKTHFGLNYAYKILINIIYGLSNSEFGPFYDAEYTLKTCVNGMLTISMMIEELTMRVPDMKVLQANTDGITIMYKKEFEEEIEKIIKENEVKTGLVVETVNFKKMVIYDVNNYMSIDENGEVKQKGFFQTRETMEKNGWFNKNPSGNIIPIALNNYFINGTSVDDTVRGCNNILEFCYGDKSNKKYKWLISTLENGVIRSTFSTARLVRYYVAGNTSIAKVDVEMKKSILANATSMVTLAQTIKNPEITSKKQIGAKKNNEYQIVERYPELNRQYYIDECMKIIDNI